jgi:hypothetical protein
MYEVALEMNKNYSYSLWGALKYFSPIWGTMRTKCLRSTVLDELVNLSKVSVSLQHQIDHKSYVHVTQTDKIFAFHNFLSQGHV